MGCDIHLHIEIKLGGRWEHLGHPNVGRNYELFAVMAGVRGDEKPIAPPRGLPSDASVVTKFDFANWESDAHTPSYLNAEEIARLEDWLHERKIDMEWELLHCYLFGNSFGGFHKYPTERSNVVEDLRFVFWFDN